ncbi:MAG: SpoIID/LytB domain-containing protein [Thermodesulfobacteriota bacterium]
MIYNLSIKEKFKYRAASLILFTLLFTGCVVISKTPIENIAGISASSGELIRVEVLNSVKIVRVRGAKKGVSLMKSTPEGLLSVNGSIYERFTLTPLDISGAGTQGFIYIDGRPYRGTLEVRGTDKGLQIINELYLEDYLAGLINNEISSSWPLESVRAQAIIARTYALYQKEKRAEEEFHLSGTDKDQVYKGSATEDNAAFRAVQDTRGEVLTYNGELALTLYHSNAGGRTESAANVWGSDFKYLRSVRSPKDNSARNFEWTFTIGAGALERSLKTAGFDIEKVRAVQVREKTASRRVKKLQVTGSGSRIELTGERLRSILGYGNIRSTLFRVRKRGGSFVFIGKGSGHGVGLSQWGAKGMADAGRKYRGILSYYYPGTRLQKLY